MEDEALVRAFQRSRDPAPFQALVMRHRDRVVRLISSVLGPGRLAEAEDVAQEVFVKVYDGLAGFRLESRFTSWLYRIAYRQAIDRRSLARLARPHVAIDVLDSETGVPSADPQEACLTNEVERQVGDAVDDLPDLYRSVLHMRYWLGMSVAEIATALGAPAGTVKSYLFRARKRIGKALADREIGHD